MNPRSPRRNPRRLVSTADAQALVRQARALVETAERL